MLIEKKPTIAVNDTISFRLTTGDEILAKLTAMDDSSITVSKPVIVQMQMVSPTQAGLGFAPFMATADDTSAKYRFERKNIICDPIKPRQDIGLQYIKMTTGIEIASAAPGLIV
jgi:hypothetical protein